MHSKRYYRNSKGDLDPHARKLAWKNHEAEKINKHKLKSVTDWNDYNYTTAVMDTLWTNVNWLNTNRANTQLALRKNLSMIPREEVVGALREWNFSLVPIENTLPAPVKQNQIILIA